MTTSRPARRLNPINEFVRRAIRRLRMERGLRVQDMADRTGIPLGSYSCLETGYFRISLEHLFRILSVLGVEVGAVWPRWSDEPKPVERVDARLIHSAMCEATKRLRDEVSLDDILDTVCSVFEVTRDALESPSRQRHLALARTVATVLTREQPHLTIVSLSRRLGRDVSSLSHCLRRLDERRPWDHTLETKIEDARRQLANLHPERKVSLMATKPPPRAGRHELLVRITQRISELPSQRERGHDRLDESLFPDRCTFAEFWDGYRRFAADTATWLRDENEFEGTEALFSTLMEHAALALYLIGYEVADLIEPARTDTRGQA